MPKGEKKKAKMKKETYEEYCERCKKNFVEPLPLIKWNALHDTSKFTIFG